MGFPGFQQSLKTGELAVHRTNARILYLRNGVLHQIFAADCTYADVSGRVPASFLVNLGRSRTALFAMKILVSNMTPQVKVLLLTLPSLDDHKSQKLFLVM